ncbi:MAG: NOP58 family protein, partial [Candidatus Marsarchaeota archaeon]|nr:NOP58 family protein [Candidatus Marsarchaeota archaeon]
LRERLMRRARSGVSAAYTASAADHSIIQAINSYNEIERIRNTIYERLEEWYGAYFPNVRLENHDTFARLVSNVGRKEVEDDTLKDILGNESLKVIEAIRSSRGFPDMDPAEHREMRGLAEEMLKLSELQRSLDAFLDAQTKKVMPNVVYLIDHKIAAEMLGKAGSLQRLATMPASTIQLLGAERALFKHMKYGSKPPKYGYLFKLPELAAVNKKEKGRMARIYATKISIAARADAMTKRFIADVLKQQIEKARKRNAAAGREVHGN